MPTGPSPCWRCSTSANGDDLLRERCVRHEQDAGKSPASTLEYGSLSNGNGTPVTFSSQFQFVATFCGGLFSDSLKAIRTDIDQKRQLAKRLELGLLPDNPLYRYNNLYLEKLLGLAEKHSARVIFMYLPYLNAAPTPENAAWFSERGKLIVPDAILEDAKLWQNAEHLNFFGANALSSWLAQTLSAEPGSTYEVRVDSPSKPDL